MTTADDGADAAPRSGSGPTPADLRAVEEYLSSHGLRIESADLDRRSVTARGTVAQASAAFGVSLGRYESGSVAYRGREGPVHLPADLAPLVQAVLGLDDRPQARVHLRRGDQMHPEALPHPSIEALSERPAHPDGGRATHARPPFWATQVAHLYEFPTGVSGRGQTIGLIELGGGYTEDELAAYFAKARVTAPTIVPVGVDGAENAPDGGEGDGEVLLDIEVCGSVAPGARLVVYFADPTDRGFISAVSTAVHDKTHAPSVISISWGASEDAWTEQARQAFADVLADAAGLGVTVLAAAGDHGSGDGVPDDQVHVNFPAAVPHVVACGGTSLRQRAGAIVSETVWNNGDGWATGGGVSRTFPAPPWQTVKLPANLDGTGRPGRGVPDVAGNADIATGYLTLVHGTWAPNGGTSAVAPLYAGLVALLNEALGRPVGALAPLLYGIPPDEARRVFRDVTSGDNSVPMTLHGPARKGYTAEAGWDACTGFGSLRGTGLLEYLRARTVAAAAP